MASSMMYAFKYRRVPKCDYFGRKGLCCIMSVGLWNNGVPIACPYCSSAFIQMHTDFINEICEGEDLGVQQCIMFYKGPCTQDGNATDFPQQSCMCEVCSVL